jgi:hypothetical protein
MIALITRPEQQQCTSLHAFVHAKWRMLHARKDADLHRLIVMLKSKEGTLLAISKSGYRPKE